MHAVKMDMNTGTLTVETVSMHAIESGMHAAKGICTHTRIHTHAVISCVVRAFLQRIYAYFCLPLCIRTCKLFSMQPRHECMKWRVCGVHTVEGEAQTIGESCMHTVSSACTHTSACMHTVSKACTHAPACMHTSVEHRSFSNIEHALQLHTHTSAHRPEVSGFTLCSRVFLISVFI